MSDHLEVKITKADTGQLITEYKAFQDDGKKIYSRCDVYANLNALCRGLKQVYQALEVLSSNNGNIEDEIANIRKQLKDIEVKADGPKKTETDE